MLRVTDLLVYLLLQHSGICNVTGNCKMGKSFVLTCDIEKCPYCPYGPILF